MCWLRKFCFSLTWLIALNAHAQTTAELAAAGVAANAFQVLVKKTESAVNSCQANVPERKPQIITPAGFVYTAQCKCVSAQTEKTKYVLELSNTNDNSFLGLAGEGNDFGYTFGMRASLMQLKGERQLEFKATSDLYTRRKEVGTVDGTTYYEGSSFSDGSVRYNQRMVDVEKFNASLKTGKKFYVHAVIGVEKRIEEKGPVSFAANTQENWHSMLGLYNFNYVSPSTGLPGYYYSPSGGGYIVFDAYGNPINVVNQSPIPGLLSQASSVPFERAFHPFVFNSQLGIGTSYKIPFIFECTAETEAGIDASVTPQLELDPNTRVYLGQNVEMGIGSIQTNSSQNRVNVSAGSIVYYYPVQATEKSGRLGLTPSGSVSSNYFVGENKSAMLTPFLQMSLPLGRQAFELYNDHDTIMDFGIRLTF